jgi:hypothetical protein
LQKQPVAPIAAIATITIGALVYHIWLRPRESKA